MSKRNARRSRPSNTSKNGSAASKKALVERQADSVFDFLYHDARRIGSFLSQFDNAGHLQSLTEADETSQTAQRGYGWKAAVSLPNLTGVPGEGPEAKLGFDVAPGATGRQNSERTYDPYWTNARTFLDYADGAGLLVRNIAKARVGQLVLVQGRLALLDTRLVRAALDMPNFANHALLSATNGEEATNAVGLEIMKVLPMEVQATVRGSEGSAWMTLSPEHMTVSASDLMLKHGYEIAGNWSLVGVLDALPDDGGAPSNAVQAALSTALQSAGAFGTNALGLMTMMLAPMARLTMGRPAAARGITPLLIFRQVTGE